MSKAKKIAPIHPGEVLLEDFMRPTRTSTNRLALELHVPVTRVAEIVKGQRAITADTALRLARHLGTTAAFWMNLQTAYELDVAEDEKERKKHRFAAIPHPRRPNPSPLRSG